MKSNLLTNILVINMDNEQARLARMKQQLDKHRLSLTRIPAVDGRKLSESEFKNIPFDGTKTRGAVGCGMSHRKAWKHMIDNQLPYALILEDDANITEHITKVNRLPIPDDVGILYLGYHLPDTGYTICSRFSLDKRHDTTFQKINDFVYKHDNPSTVILGMYGYIISLQAAKWLYENYRVQEAVDMYIPKHGPDALNVYLLHPKLITHCYSFPSSIMHYNGFSDKITKRNIVNNPSIINYRAFNQRKAALFIVLLLIALYSQRRHKYRMVIIVGVFILYIMLTRHCRVGVYNIYRFEPNDIRKHIDYLSISSINFDDYNMFDPFASAWTRVAKTTMVELFSTFSTTADREGVDQWSITAGSLLGWARHDKEIIPWDDDFDLTVEDVVFERLKKRLSSHPELDIYDHGSFYKIFFKDRGFKIPYYLHQNTVVRWPFIDIFKHRIDNNRLYSPELSDKPVELTPGKVYFTDRMIGVKTRVFVDYHKILTAFYGPEWDSVYASSSYTHRLEKSVENHLRRTEPKRIVDMLI